MGMIPVHKEDQRAIMVQIIQNIIVLSPIIFAQKLYSGKSLALAGIAFMIVNLLATLVVLTSSWFLHQDRRPENLVPGKLAKPLQTTLVLFAAPLVIAFVINVKFGLLCLLYAVLALVHDLFLMRVVLLDVIFLGVEFSLKAIVGAAAIDVHISPWLMICTFLAALIVALGKRRNELTTSETGRYPRLVLADYNIRLIDQMLAVVTSSTFIAYALYTISEHAVQDFKTTNLLYTQPMVLYGILRYLYLVRNANLNQGSEIIILRDPPMLINAVLWLVCVIAIIYSHP